MGVYFLLLFVNCLLNNLGAVSNGKALPGSILGLCCCYGISHDNKPRYLT